LDSIFSSWTPATPGGVVCVVDHGKVIYRKGFGLADIQRKVPNNPELKYDVASIAKQFTAMCIALLEEQGKLTAEDNLKKFYPDMQIVSEVKIRHLLDHTSGLRDASVLAILSGKMNLKGEVRKNYDTKDFYLECFKRETDLNFVPGSELAYTNFNFVLLADIVEKVSGQTFSQFADSAIFKPLGMSNTIIRDKRKMKIANEANGYLFTGKKFKPRKGLGGIVGDHNLLTTVDDMAKWELNFFANKLGNGNQDLIDKVCTSSKFNNGEPTRYNYGLWINEYKGVPRVEHGGDDGRHTSVAVRFPKQELIIIVFANSSRYNDTQLKTYQVADVLLKNDLRAEPVKKEEFTYITLSAQEVQSHVGLYTQIDEKGLARMARLTYDAPDLYISPNPHWKGLKLSPVTPEYYVAKNSVGETVGARFSTDSLGKHVSTTYLTNPARHYTLHKESIVPFKDFRGSYFNASTGARIKVKSKKNKLTARKGIFRIPLISFGTDTFFGPDSDVLFIFGRDQTGKVVRMKANAPDFRNFMFVKE
jgi:CubicO group peptidase (beta-lactamase class C family)